MKKGKFPIKLIKRGSVEVGNSQVKISSHVK